MATITIDVPDQLAEKLQPYQDRLTEVLALGIKELSPLPTQVYQYVLAFLASNPTPEDLASFRPTDAMQARLRALADREKKQQLTDAERAELDEYERIEHLIILLKTNALPSK